MVPLDISDDMRSAKNSMGDLGIDDNGYEIYVGLTREESEWMVAYDRMYSVTTRGNRHPTHEEKTRRSALNEKFNNERRKGLVRNRSR